MRSDEQAKAPASAASPFTSADVLAIVRVRGWLTADPTPELMSWCERAASLLGGHSADRLGLAGLLELIFHYDAHEIVARVESHVVLSRYAARDVIRQLALHLVNGVPLTSERFKEIITQMKEKLELRGRELFHPIRLALAGRAGEGELDRVILLVDEAAAIPFAVPVKPVRTRILEFCTALD
jgi:glutamyl/glutaminyl-tRNA synthetase